MKSILQSSCLYTDSEWIYIIQPIDNSNEVNWKNVGNYVTDRIYKPNSSDDITGVYRASYFNPYYGVAID
jgi:hypothetical protein